MLEAQYFPLFGFCALFLEYRLPIGCWAAAELGFLFRFLFLLLLLLLRVGCCDRLN
jgi:hypothetical protein